MRTLAAAVAVLMLVTFSVEAKKRKIPAVQNTPLVKEHKKMQKEMAKLRKAPKHRQRVN